MSHRLSAWLRPCVRALPALLAVIAAAQTPVSKLIFPPALLRPILQPGTLSQESAANNGLHIAILKGDRGVNIIKKKTAVQPVVEVRDRNNLPVAGAVVTFTSPSNGPGVVFMNGSRSITLVTGSNGQATVVAMKPVNPGGFQIGISSSFQGQAATATISMTNAMTATAAAAAAAGVGGTVAAGAGAAAGLSAVAIGAIVGVAAAAAVGIGVGLSSHGSSSPTSTPSTTTIGGAGTPTVGPPH